MLETWIYRTVAGVILVVFGILVRNYFISLKEEITEGLNGLNGKFDALNTKIIEMDKRVEENTLNLNHLDQKVDSQEETYRTRFSDMLVQIKGHIRENFLEFENRLLNTGRLEPTNRKDNNGRKNS